LTAMYTLKKGGSYDRFKMMIESFLEKQWEVHCLSLTPIQIEHFCYHNHVIINPFRIRHGWVAKFIVLFLFPIYSFLIGYRKKIDLVVVFGPLYAFLLAIPKLVLKRPMVTLIRGSLTFGFKMQDSPKYFHYVIRLLENFGLFSSDRIITNNVSVRDEILKSLGGRKNINVQFLYNNIPPMSIREMEDVSQTRNKYGIPGNSKVLMTAGILNRGKNIETLIECLPKIEVKNIYILIAGDGSTEIDFRYRDSLLRLAKKLRVDKKIIFTGWVEKEDLWKIYLASDLFVLPSLNEGMPNAMLEALGLGLPCMGSDIPGIKDILKYDELVFDPRDETDLVNKIRRIFSDDQFFNQIKRLCEERKEAFNFDWKERLFQTVTTGLNG
jgi:glycosyltransferase involved in cell wall biosynthesis